MSAPVPPRAWAMLAVGVAAQTATTLFVSAPAFLIPLFHTERGLSLAEAGTIAAAPTFGLVFTLIAWGALADRIGEKWVIVVGLLLTALAAAGAAFVGGYAALGVFLLLGGAASGSTNAASGRLIVGWFPKQRRGLAMGIRQMCQPLGVTIAALTVPPVAAAAGVGAAFAIPLVLMLLGAVAGAIVIVDPPRAPRTPDAPAAAPATATATTTATATATANPYRSSGFLWRIHGVSALLVVPQFTLTTFGLVWLTVSLGWQPTAAGLLVALAQFIGAFGRLGVGALSDRMGSRVRPLRGVAFGVIAAMAALAALDGAGLGIAAGILFVVASTLSVADNGLAFTSVAEAAGPRWAGRALGTQNTGQFLVASAVGPAIGAVIGVFGYPAAFVVSAVCAAIATPLVPAAASERDHL